MKDTTRASKDRMGRLNNDIVDIIDCSDATILESIAVLKLAIARLERSFEVSVMPKRIEGKKNG